MRDVSSRLWLAGVGAVVVVGGAFGWSWWKWQADLKFQSTDIPSEQQPVSASPATNSALSGLMSDLPTTQPLPTPLATPLPVTVKPKVATPTPKTSPIAANLVDVTFTSNAGNVQRSYDDGAHGWLYQSALSTSPFMVWSELNSFWSALEDSCVDITANQNLASKSITIDIYIDGNKKLATTWGDQSGVPAQVSPGGHHVVCFRSSEGTGVHTIKYVLNGNHQVTESNYTNNEKTLTYEIKADAEAPSFSISGPVKETEGTCFHLNDVKDNVSTYSQMTKQHRFDSGNWSDASDRLCLTGSVGETHTYYARVVDARGNTAEKSQGFSVQ